MQIGRTRMFTCSLVQSMISVERCCRDKADGGLKIKARGRIGDGPWVSLATAGLELPMRAECRLQRHRPVPIVT